ncbi:methyltransferase domain-containing protein [Psychrilyobacter piezotolerans]|uniref:Methyltransferase domain-containing protein n=2 Tax=Fusobacteriaceae TaxID=203492 RepID=A0ABX9KF27_9FUSO|nr:class I SAM-dependent methyltransferase [Psychrilyobacter sp. S5]REI40047.1 methyltransferase domain-containing protein [Psychrilyobacter piezotolerans]
MCLITCTREYFKFMRCNICGNEDLRLIGVKNKAGLKKYYRCKECEFIFIDKAHILSYKDEGLRYEVHNNEISDPSYRSYFKKFINYIEDNLDKDNVILDYGSGPQPVLADVMEEDGYRVDIYDKFFYNKKDYLDKKYDVIISTEVFEHIYKPVETLETLLSILKKNGKLILMTAVSPPTDEEFRRWWYIQDPTHVVFYNEKTFEVIGRKYDLNIIKYNHKNIIIFQRR